MIEVGITIACGLLIVVTVESLWRRKKLRGKYARKAMHMSLGVLLALTPFYLSWPEMQFIGLGSMALLLLGRMLGQLKSVYDITRVSWGDIIGPGTFLVLAFFEPPRLLFVAPVLIVAIADGLAAVVGTKYGKRNRYTVFGSTKSLAGTATFFLASFIITAGIIVCGGVDTTHNMLVLLLLLPTAATFVENTGIYGTDNVLITLVTIGILNMYL